ncbi:metal-binding protein [Spirulina sp. 06S082]|uniref:metal-binding protein n=1 Tax=Spirulina sp. 06S082 TaxID=3110248 RepID=UPI002B1F46FF|nr:metal-binding protein [Spirulina sp. 06S082]MEA5467980.1 metal-binding protein [Spirulina sp. 06S082]
MPSGRIHDRITLWCLPWLVLLTFLLTRSGELTLLAAAGFLFSGLMFGPDLDIYSVQFKRWGWLRWIWIPYQKALSHRSQLSHGLLIGTILRLLYLFVIASVIGVFGVTIAQLVWGFPWNWQNFWQICLQKLQQYSGEAIALFFGLELGSMSHSLADWTGSTYKRIKRNGIKTLLPKWKAKKKRRKSRQKNKS